jgi:prepilin peptidase CpaA
MMTPDPLQHALLIAFAGLMLAAAFEDFRRLVIPNVVSVSLCALWPLTAPGWMGAAGSIGCAAAVFLGGALLFSRGYMGGGDVKLLSAATLWAGPTGAPMLLVVTGLLGGLLALVLVLPGSAQMAAAARATFGLADTETTAGGSTPVPYGIAIAAASVFVLFQPYFR